jgi:GNAT superfamily N-acetyltransferase
VSAGPGLAASSAADAGSASADAGSASAAGGRPASAAIVCVRRATEDDRQALADMLARCTGETRYRRFHGYVNVFPRQYLTEALSGSPVHLALVASVADGPVVALASCRAVFEGVAELGMLIEDEWQQRGIGRRLLGEILDYASRSGLRALQARMLAEQSWIAGLLRRYGPCEAVGAGEVLTVTLPLPPIGAHGTR